jgi:hypothetical protein
MFKLMSPLAMAGVILFLTCAAPAKAASITTFVSAKGTDSGTCAFPATPCRTFQFAINQTSAFGAVKVLDPAGYGPMTITKSISITGIEGAGINGSTGNAITINAGPNDVVNLSHLILDGTRNADNGILLNSGGSLTITHCTIRNFVQRGIILQPTAGKTTFLIADAFVLDNPGDGIGVVPQGVGLVQGTLDHVSMNKNGGDGLVIDGGFTSGSVGVRSVESMANDNGIAGFVVGARAVLWLAHSAATGNNTGVSIALFTQVISFGDNHIRGNNSDVSGTLTNVGTQ